MGNVLSLFGAAPKPQKLVKPDFETVYKTYYSSVLSYLQRKMNNRQDAEDLTSEVFLYCYDHYASYDPEKSAVSTWVYLVANSRLKNYYRDRQENSDISALENVLPDESSDIERGVYLEQLRKTIAEAISQLPERQQQIVILSYFKQKNSNEIAALLNMTPVNVRVQLSRALSKMEATCKQFLE